MPRKPGFVCLLKAVKGRCLSQQKEVSGTSVSLKAKAREAVNLSRMKP